MTTMIISEKFSLSKKERQEEGKEVREEGRGAGEKEEGKEGRKTGEGRKKKTQTYRIKRPKSSAL